MTSEAWGPTNMLSYCSDSIPGEDLQDKIEAAEQWEVGIDLVVHRHNLEDLSSCDLTPHSLIAYECHGRNLLSSESDRAQFVAHLRGWKAFSRRPVVTALYETSLSDDGAALKLYSHLADIREGKILIESLGSKRTVFRPSLALMSAFVKRLDPARFGLVADTAHIWHDQGDGLYETLNTYASHLDVVHLKGENGRPPSRSRLIDFEHVVQSLSPFRGSLCVECAPFANQTEFGQDVVTLKELLSPA